MAEIKQAKFVDKTGQEKDAVFIGAERAIFDDDGKRLDQKLDEMKEATGLVATDTKGVIGTAGAEVSLQALIDGVAKKVIDELVTNATLTQTLASYMTKSLMSSTQVNDANKVPTSALAYAMQQQITQLNSNLFPIQGIFIEKQDIDATEDTIKTCLLDAFSKSSTARNVLIIQMGFRSGRRHTGIMSCNGGNYFQTIVFSYYDNFIQLYNYGNGNWIVTKIE